MEKLDYVPGHLKCKKCGFHLVSNTLYMQSGTIGANNKPSQCMNGCGPMWRITWKDYANEAVKGANKLAVQRARLTKEVELFRAFCDKKTIKAVDVELEQYHKIWAEVDKEILDGN